MRRGKLGVLVTGGIGLCGTVDVVGMVCVFMLEGRIEELTIGGIVLREVVERGVEVTGCVGETLERLELEGI